MVVVEMSDIREFVIHNPTPGQYTDRGRLYSSDILRDMVERAQDRVFEKRMLVYAPTDDPVASLDRVIGLVQSLKFDDYIHVGVRAMGPPHELYLSMWPCVYPVMNGTIGENGVIISASLDRFEMGSLRPHLPNLGVDLPSPKPKPEPKGRILRP
jgi:hypothetical protein